MTLMRKEAQECAEVSHRFLQQVLPLIQQESEQWLPLGYQCLDVLGRGSSSHAGTLLRYAMAEYSPLMIGAAMPLAAVHQKNQADHSRTVLVAISQSGKSPDLLQYAERRKAQGARVVALVNSEGSELAAIAQASIVLQAGPELSVAATKSTLAACLAGLGLAASIDPEKSAPLIKGLHALPRLLEMATQDGQWSALTEVLPEARAIYFVGRGATLGIAKELALKVSETTGIPALAYSSAEFLHGPIGAVSAQTPVVGLSTDPAQHASIVEALSRAHQRGAPTLRACHGASSQLPIPTVDEKFTAALSLLPSAYLAIEAAAVRMGRNPDSPAGLAKVTHTL